VADPLAALAKSAAKAPAPKPAPESDAKVDAMSDMIAAFKAGDAKAAALAFERASEACASKSEEDEEDYADEV